MNSATDAESRKRTVPKANLFIVGAPKCGTTAWFHYLRSHPDIYFPDSKEDCFFATDLPNFRFIHSEQEYSKLFAPCGSARIVGEASAMYLFSADAAKNIRSYNPDAKILIFLREQHEYLPALHNQFLWEFSESIVDFQQAWALSGSRGADTIPPACLEPRTLDYAAMGRFREQVERYLTAFPTEQVHVVRFRDWTADPRRTYCEILKFLGVEDDYRRKFPPINQGVTYRSRRVVNFLYRPPHFARKLASIARRLPGLGGPTIGRLANDAVGLLSAPGYKRDIGPALRDEISRFYEDDNRLLDERLRTRFRAAPSPSTSGSLSV